MSLPFTNIREVWPSVKRGLEVIQRRCPEVRWRPEDIYAACVNGDAILCFEDENFIVLKEFIDPFSLARVLWVWVAYGTGINAMQERLDEYAREQGYDEIRLTSSRKGWASVKGWEFIEATYRREL
jgi:hypothetical protein